MSNLEKGLAEVVRELDIDLPQCYARESAYIFIRTHHAEIAQNAEAISRCTALYKDWIAKAEQASANNDRTQAANLWEHAEQLKEALR